MSTTRLYYLLVPMSLIFMFGKGKEPDYSKVLPGVVKVSNSLYYDQTEITNLNWNEYLHWIAEKSGRKSAEYQDALPDTNVWGGNDCCDSVMMNLYLRHPEFRDYPVVGVTQTQAMRYCAWRTDRVKENLAANKKEKKAPAQYLYRLPSIEEWQLMYADLEQLPFLVGDEGKSKYRGMARFNLKRDPIDKMGVASTSNDGADITAPVKSYWPNQYGVYNIVGNVSEWVQEENMHVGGYWNTDKDEDSSIPQLSESASSKIGFRCVCEVMQDES